MRVIGRPQAPTVVLLRLRSAQVALVADGPRIGRWRPGPAGRPRGRRPSTQQHHFRVQEVQGDSEDSAHVGAGFTEDPKRQLVTCPRSLDEGLQTELVARVRLEQHGHGAGVGQLLTTPCWVSTMARKSTPSAASRPGADAPARQTSSTRCTRLSSISAGSGSAWVGRIRLATTTPFISASTARDCSPPISSPTTRPIAGFVVSSRGGRPGVRSWIASSQTRHSSTNWDTSTLTRLPLSPSRSPRDSRVMG